MSEFNYHVQNIVKSCNYHIPDLRQIRPVLDLEIAKRIACRLIDSRLNNCRALGTARRPPTTTPEQLCARRLLRPRSVNRRRCVGTPAALVTNRATYWVQAGVTVLQGVSRGQPSYLASMLTPYRPTPRLRSSTSGQLAVPPHNNNFAARRFSCAVPRIFTRSLFDQLNPSHHLRLDSKLFCTFLNSQ
jgi:hypothetical protein